MKTNERRSGCSGIVLVIVIVLATWNLISPFIPEQRSSYENVDLTYGVYYASSRNWHEKQSLEWLFEGDGKIVISDSGILHIKRLRTKRSQYSFMAMRLERTESLCILMSLFVI